MFSQHIEVGEFAALPSGDSTRNKYIWLFFDTVRLCAE